MRGLKVVAILPIRIGEQIVYNYNTTEYEMAEPFACRCGSAQCGGEIRGF